ncbi:unnamed protein product [Amoebophrya sp. A25]|nr:unnamed protein product [Amoebophrya sp. A25]|eukprot:GSA25T00024734001.1
MTVNLVPGFAVDVAVVRGDFGDLCMEIDGKSQSLYNMMNACTNVEKMLGDDPTSLPIFKSFPSVWGKRGIMFIDRLEIHDSRFFGQGFGSMFFNTGLEEIENGFLNGTGPVYLKPFPLQWECRDPEPMEPTNGEKRNNTQTLRK